MNKICFVAMKEIGKKYRKIFETRNRCMSSDYFKGNTIGKSNIFCVFG